MRRADLARHIAIAPASVTRRPITHSGGRAGTTVTRYRPLVRAVLRAANPPVEWRIHLMVSVVALIAWLAVIAGVDREGAGVAGFVAAWTVMMVAMMLPSAAPFVLLFRRGSTVPATAALAAGYLAVWAGFGFAAWMLHQAPMDIPVAAVLAAAGAYQLTPAKQACLQRCRTPADFLVERWRANPFVLEPITAGGASAAAGHSWPCLWSPG